MKATIIIPTYRRLRLLRRAMASAAALDFDSQDYEVIVVNDGGPGSRAQIRSWWRGHPDRLQYAHTRHRGLSAAVNRGLRAARGEYCTILPDDDLILPNKLRVMCGFLDDHPDVSVAYSLPRYFDARGRRRSTPSHWRRFLRRHPVLTWDHILSGHGLAVHGTSTVYRTDICLGVGGWDRRLKTAEEYEFHLRLLKLGHDFHAVPVVTTGYRVHGGSKSRVHSRDRGPVRRYIRRKLKRL